MNRLSLIGLLVFCCLPVPLLAQQAQLLLYPTRLVLEQNERSAILGLKNTGDASGGYRIELVDMHMDATGAVEQVKPGEEEPFSARHFIRLSPRSVTLEPGQDQNVRILIRKPAKLEPGEYRTHIKVTLVEANLEGAEAAKSSAAKDVTVTIKPRLSLIIPLIIRQGETHYAMHIPSATLRYVSDKQGGKIPYADIVLGREGNRSSMGDLTVEYINEQGVHVTVKQLAGLPVYRPTESRLVSLPLEVPKGVTLGKGSLHVIYRAQAREGGAVLAEGNFPL